MNLPTIQPDDPTSRPQYSATTDLQWLDILEIVYCDSEEVGGRHAQPVGEEERQMIQKFANNQLSSEEKQAVLKNMAWNSTALEYFASLIRKQQTGESAC